MGQAYSIYREQQFLGLARGWRSKFTNRRRDRRDGGFRLGFGDRVTWELEMEQRHGKLYREITWRVDFFFFDFFFFRLRDFLTLGHVENQVVNGPGDMRRGC